MTSAFLLTRNGTPIVSLELATASIATQADVLPVSEIQRYGLEIDNREPDVSYRVMVGDIPAESCDNCGPPRPRGRRVEWYDSKFFDGAHGIVCLRLFSRSEGEDEWKERAQFKVSVTSSKLTATRYNAMFEQLRMLSANIVFDLISKTLRSFALDRGSKTPFVRTSLLELKVIQKLWPSLASSINLIESQSAKTLKREYQVRRCYSGQALDPRTIQLLVLKGVDPRRNSQDSFTANISRLVESTDLPENRMIKGFLLFLKGRIQDCRTAMFQQIEGIQEGEIWRSRGSNGLYEMEDVPRINMLKRHWKSSLETERQIQQAMSLPFLRKVKPLLEIVSTPVIRNVAPYGEFVQLMLDYLSTGVLILDDSQDERIKSTDRLYEQWVFLQVVSAFQNLGLTCTSQEGLLNRSKAFRFTLDFDRGARVVFRTSSNKRLSVRYEPWILPKEDAIDRRESVFRSGSSRVAWSPDILIELLPELSDVGEVPICSYAITLDAKYSSRIRDHQWNSTGKYNQIRATSSGRQVGRQLWLIYPGQQHDDDDFPIKLRDSSVAWTDSGPDCEMDETVEGMAMLRPSTSIAFDETSRHWIGKPEAAAIELAHGLLNFLGIKHKSSPDNLG